MQVQQYQSLSSRPSLTKRTSSAATLDVTRSSSSIDSNQVEYKKLAIAWILKLRKKLSIAKDTLYVAIDYINKLTKKGFLLNQANYQCLAAAAILVSSKMNEIYPPKMSSLIYRGTKQFSKEDLTEAQGTIIDLLDYDIAFDQTTYHYLARMLKEDKEKLDQSQKLLSLVIGNKEATRSGQQMLALAIIYLIKPTQLKDYSASLIQRIKILAGKVYNMYITAKSASRGQQNQQ